MSQSAPLEARPVPTPSPSDWCAPLDMLVPNLLLRPGALRVGALSRATLVGAGWVPDAGVETGLGWLREHGNVPVAGRRGPFGWAVRWMEAAGRPPNCPVRPGATRVPDGQHGRLPGPATTTTTGRTGRSALTASGPGRRHTPTMPAHRHRECGRRVRARPAWSCHPDGHADHRHAAGRPAAPPPDPSCDHGRPPDQPVHPTAPPPDHPSRHPPTQLPTMMPPGTQHPGPARPGTAHRHGR